MGNYRYPLIGIVGKTNVGKTTLFMAMTLGEAEASNRPFTTIEPNKGVAYVRRRCPHVDFGLPKCDPRTGYCRGGVRFIPVDVMDVAGLIKGAHEGRGLGNKFMDDIRQADAFILVVDASGSTDEEGNPVEQGSFNPVEEAVGILEEISLWFEKIVAKDWQRFALTVETSRKDPVDMLHTKLSGLSIERRKIIEALNSTGLLNKKLTSWTAEDIRIFSRKLLSISKPYVIAANKADLPSAREGVEKLRKAFPNTPVVPVSAAAELALKKAAEKGVIRYVPGDSGFEVLDKNALTPQQLRALEYIRENVLEKWGSTGVQQSLEALVYEAMNYVTVYTVEDAGRLTDSKGNILPDAYLVPSYYTVRDIARIIHTELAERFHHAIDVRRKSRVGDDAGVYDGMVVKIVTSR